MVVWAATYPPPLQRARRDLVRAEETRAAGWKIMMLVELGTYTGHLVGLSDG